MTRTGIWIYGTPKPKAIVVVFCNMIALWQLSAGDRLIEANGYNEHSKRLTKQAERTEKYDGKVLSRPKRRANSRTLRAFDWLHAFISWI